MPFRAVIRFLLLVPLAGLPITRPVSATPIPIKAAVVRSTGTQFLSQTIWNDLNTGWSNFGDVPVEIDYTSLAGSNLTLPQIQATGTDVLIISAAGFLTYQNSEVNAIIDYVNSGHGIVITYHSFGFSAGDPKRNLASLVGLSETMSLGTNTWPDPFSFDLLAPDHLLFSRLPGSYATGVPALASPSTIGSVWQLTTGTVLAHAMPTFQTFTGNGIIVANDTDIYRGLYFANYPEDKADGSNQQDMQVFYNALLWTSGVPEPGMLVLCMISTVFLLWRQGRDRRTL